MTVTVYKKASCTSPDSWLLAAWRPRSAATIPINQDPRQRADGAKEIKRYCAVKEDAERLLETAVHSVEAFHYMVVDH